MYRGSKCQVCTGCGRCAPQAYRDQLLKKIYVSDASALEEKIKLQYPDEHTYLIAVDIGTTTVAMRMMDCQGKTIDTFARVNPQISYGRDVLSRIEAAKKPEQLQDMCNRIRLLLVEGLQFFREKIQFDLPKLTMPSKQEQAQFIFSIAANTTMQYLLMGWNPEELGKAPFHVTNKEGASFEIDGVKAFLMPTLSAFVGGDILAGMLALEIAQEVKQPLEQMGERLQNALFIDLGTNGEMVYFCDGKRYACATAAGPAFEGGPNLGVWGSDMIHMTAALLRSGYIDDTGLLQEPWFETGITIGDCRISQEAIRALQLAKAAICTGIEILERESGQPFNGQTQVYLAGGFGYHLNCAEAAMIGLFPRKLQKNALAVGNTSLLGAAIYGCLLLNGKVSKRRFGLDGNSILSDIKRDTQILNLAEHPDFSATYLQNMSLCPRI